jgi:prophage DNA circulation protein
MSTYHLLDFLKDFKTTNFKVLGDMFEGAASHIGKVHGFVVRMLQMLITIDSLYSSPAASYSSTASTKATIPAGLLNAKSNVIPTPLNTRNLISSPSSQTIRTCSSKNRSTEA